MVTAPLIAPSVIDLPSVGQAARQPDQVLQVIVGKDETLSLKERDQTRSIDLKTLAQTVKRTQAGAARPAVVISADKSVRYETVVKVMDTLQRAGVARVGLSVQMAP